MMLPTASYFKNLLVLDIETVPMKARFEELSPARQKLWERKARYMLEKEPEKTAGELFEERGGIFAEFGKIVTISIGVFYFDDEQNLNFRVKALASHEETEILSDFAKIITAKFNPKKLSFIAHNGKEFDYPYIARRMLIQGITLPEALDVRGKKPWEISHLDTMELWRFGDWKNFTPLALLADVFGLPTSKGDIDGSQVRGVYYEENDLKRIAHYCNQDVALTGQVFLKLNGWQPIPSEYLHVLPVEI